MRKRLRCIKDIRRVTLAGASVGACAVGVAFMALPGTPAVAATHHRSNAKTAAAVKKIHVPHASKKADRQFQALYAKAIRKGEKKLVVYENGCTTQQVAFYRRFTKQFPEIKVTCVSLSDTVAQQKISAEASTGKHIADLYTSGTLVMPPIAKYCTVPKIFTAKVPKRDRILGGRLMVVGNSGFGFIYNTDKVTKKQAPKTWDALLQPQWKGQMEMGTPLIGGGPRAVMANMLIPANAKKYGVSYDKKLAAQDVFLNSAEAPVASDVAAGRFKVGLVVIQAFYTAVKSKGGHVGFVFPMKSPNFMVQLASCAVKGAPDPDAALLFDNWSYTKNGMALQAKIEGTYGALPNAPGPAGAPPLKKVKKLKQLPLTDPQGYDPYYKQLFTIFK